MSTQVALTFAVVSSGLLAGLFLALVILVNLILRGGSGDIRRIALRTAITAGIVGAIAALSTLGALVNRVGAEDMSFTGITIAALVLLIIATGVGVMFAGNTRHNPDSLRITQFRQSNWGAMAVSAVAFVLNVVALGILP